MTKNSPAALSQEQVDAFWLNGYLSLGKLFNDEEIELCRHEYDAEFTKTDRVTNLYEGSTQVKEKKRMLRIMGMCERNLTFRKLLYDPRILDRVEDLIGPNIMLFHDQALWKPAFDGGAVPWHQDNGYWMARPATLISCWMTFDDVDRDNGAMQVIPGSHLTPTWHEKSGESSVLFDIPGIDATKAVPVALPAGGCMFHHCQTLHYTQPNSTPRQRRAFAIHFMQPGTRSGSDKTDVRVGFSHPMLRART